MSHALTGSARGETNPSINRITHDPRHSAPTLSGTGASLSHKRTRYEGPDLEDDHPVKRRRATGAGNQRAHTAENDEDNRGNNHSAIRPPLGPYMHSNVEPAQRHSVQDFRCTQPLKNTANGSYNRHENPNSAAETLKLLKTLENPQRIDELQPPSQQNHRRITRDLSEVVRVRTLWKRRMDKDSTRHSG